MRKIKNCKYLAWLFVLVLVFSLVSGGTSAEVMPSVPYTSADLNYGNADSRTSKEQNDAAARPGITGSLPSLTDYEIVYLGYPIWWNKEPMII